MNRLVILWIAAALMIIGAGAYMTSRLGRLEAHGYALERDLGRVLGEQEVVSMWMVQHQSDRMVAIEQRTKVCEK